MEFLAKAVWMLIAVLGTVWTETAPNWTQIGTFFVAGLALFVSLLTLVLQRRDKKPRLKLLGKYGYIPNEPPGRPTWYIVSATNYGEVPLTLTHFYIEPAKEQAILLSEPMAKCNLSLPCKLESGDSIECQIARQSLKEHLEKLGHNQKKASFKLMAVDSLNKYRSKRLQVMLED